MCTIARVHVGVLFIYNGPVSKQHHKLKNRNLATMTADCLTCGDGARIRSCGMNKYRCRNALNEARRRERQITGTRHKYHEPNPGVCDICSGTVRVAYDHCHETGLFRGWLCMKCNTALGLVGDSTDRLQQLIAYLQKNA